MSISTHHNFSPIRDLIIVKDCTEEINYFVGVIYQKCKLFPVIGLDCEWTPTRKKNEKPNVALLQIATRDGFCVLFRTCLMDEIPYSLKKLLCDTKILKVGVGVYDDAKFLKLKYKNLVILGCFDIRHLVRMCNVYSRNESLKELTKSLLNFELQKDNVLNYNWNISLDDEQAHYAALDALAGVLIFDKLLPLYHEQVEYGNNKMSYSLMVRDYFTNLGAPCSKYIDKKVTS